MKELWIPDSKNNVFLRQYDLKKMTCGDPAMDGLVCITQEDFVYQCLGVKR